MEVTTDVEQVRKDDLPRPLVPYKEYRVRVKGGYILVMEFSFTDQRDFEGDSISDTSGVTYYPKGGRPYIIINADRHQKVRNWTLRHEKIHAERGLTDYKAGLPTAPASKWEEFEIELLVARDYPTKELRNVVMSHYEVLRVLQEYMRLGPGVEQAAKLTEFVKGALDDAETESRGTEDPSDIPPD